MTHLPDVPKLSAALPYQYLGIWQYSHVVPGQRKETGVNRGGHPLVLPFGIINLPVRRIHWRILFFNPSIHWRIHKKNSYDSFSPQANPLTLSGSPWGMMDECFPFFPFLQVQPYSSHLSLRAQNRTVSTCPLTRLCFLFSLMFFICSDSWDTPSQIESVWNSMTVTYSLGTLG